MLKCVTNNDYNKVGVYTLAVQRTILPIQCGNNIAAIYSYFNILYFI